MNISKAVDEQGREITPDPNALVDAGVVVYVFLHLLPALELYGVLILDHSCLSGPAPFPCKMTPRFPEVKAIIERELAHSA